MLAGVPSLREPPHSSSSPSFVTATRPFFCKPVSSPFFLLLTPRAPTLNPIGELVVAVPGAGHFIVVRSDAT